MSSEGDLEKEKLALERLKIRLDYRKFVLGSVFVAIAIAAIPPLFQLATAVLEYVKTQEERKTQQQAFRDTYVKEFLASAVNQDIELRIRFAEYFAFVSTDKESWTAYKDELFKRRKAIREQIDVMEKQWQQKVQAKNYDDLEQLERNLTWAYKEVGYVERNRSVAANPRAPDARVAAVGLPVTAESLVKLFEPLADRKVEVQGLLDAFGEFCDGDPNSAAMFLAYIFNETRYLRESGTEKFDYSAERLVQLWPRFFSAETARQYVGKPEEIANRIYGYDGNPLGNVEKADGYRYRGRGYLQMTGRANYRAMSGRVNVDLVKDPDELANNKVLDARVSAALVCSIWKAPGNAGSEADLLRFYKRINPGVTGLPPAFKNIYDRIRAASFAGGQ